MLDNYSKKALIGITGTVISIILIVIRFFIAQRKLLVSNIDTTLIILFVITSLIIFISGIVGAQGYDEIRKNPQLKGKYLITITIWTTIILITLLAGTGWHTR